VALAGEKRGQTSIDFLIGIGFFLATVGFVALFAMDAVTPFVGEQGGALVADRTADELVGVTFAGPPGTNVLDESCTLAFFGVGSDDGCPFDSANPLTDRVGIDDRWDLNVTVERNDPAAGQEVLCANDDGDLQSCPGETRLAAGDPADFGSDGIFTAVRVATFDDRDITVVVRIW
jgi:hypothetical protein